jgi:hypothetical protein
MRSPLVLPEATEIVLLRAMIVFLGVLAAVNIVRVIVESL